MKRFTKSEVAAAARAQRPAETTTRSEPHVVTLPAHQRWYTATLLDAEFGFHVADKSIQAKSIMDAKEQALDWAHGRATHKDRVHNLRVTTDGYTVWFQQLPVAVTAGTKGTSD